jgi:predicted MPP superfamily phosphohydrolase
MHGGQIAPFGLILHTASRRGHRYGARYRTGILHEKGVTVVISNGVGTTWMPLRLGAKPQYHLFTIRREK